MRNKIICRILCSRQILRLPSLPVCKRHPIDRPGLASGPGRISILPLAAQILNLFSRVRIKTDDMGRRIVRPDKAAQYRIRMCFRNMVKSRVLTLSGGPEQKRNVHHTVDDGPPSGARIHFIGPGPDKLPCQVKTSRQMTGGFQPPDSGLLAARQLIVNHRRGQPHKANVMMEGYEAIQYLIEPSLQSSRKPEGILIFFLLIQEPQHPGPETGSPE